MRGSLYPLPKDRINTENKQLSLSHLAKQLSGKYLLKSEILLPDDLFYYLLENSFFKSTPTIEHTSFGKKRCLRCNNMKSSLFATIPCSRCQQTHFYCRKCIHMGRVLECERLYYWNGPAYKWLTLDNPLTWTGKLTNSQQNASEKIIEKIKKGGELLIWAVTGSGKTEMLFPGLQYALGLGKRICIATPRADVVRELLPRLKNAFQHTTIQGLYSGSRDNDGTAQLIISTTHQLLRYRQAFDLMIIDEIDAFPFHKDSSLPYASKRAVKRKNTIIYLTATPRKKHRFLMGSRQLDYVFVPVRFHGCPLPVPINKKIPHLENQLHNDLLPKQFIDWIINREKQSRQLLIFVPTISMSMKLAPLVEKFLYDGEFITKKDTVQSVSSLDDLREKKIERFRQREIFCLVTTTILERGVTFPSVDVIVFLANHDVFDEQALVQIAGRVGRSGTDPDGEVMFFHEVKTNAIVKAIHMIQMMNDRSRKLN